MEANKNALPESVSSAWRETGDEVFIRITHEEKEREDAPEAIFDFRKCLDFLLCKTGGSCEAQLFDHG